MMTVIGRGSAQNLNWTLPGSEVLFGGVLVFFNVISEAFGECGINVYFNDKSDCFVISDPCIIGNVSMRGLCYSGRRV